MTTDPDPTTDPTPGPNAPLRYRLLTGPDDAEFCARISAALDQGYTLYGGPTMTSRDGQVIVGQALILPD
ncbi:MAG: DUF1737 domain-containing protein [Acidimicrobiales bacterium]